MAINFPNSPALNDQHTSAGVTWTWDGTTWKADGVTSSYVLPTAAANVKGGVKIGSGLSMTGETLAATASAITVQEEGTPLNIAATTLNFVGGNVTATGTGAVKTITVGGVSDLGINATARVLYQAGNGNTDILPAGNSGEVLTSGGDGVVPSWSTAATGGVTVQDEGNALSTAGTTLNFTGTNVTASGTGATKTITVSAALDGRSTFTATTASLANNVAGNIEVVAHKSYSLLKIKPSIAAWVTLYVDAASRTADSNRVQGADPAPDAGVIAEVITTAANQEIKMSPAVLGWHQDAGGDAVTSVFCKVVNKSGSTGTCTVSLTVVQLEA